MCNQHNPILLKAMSTESTNYVGRFAPSPTGPLHFGSLVAAVASYCDAKANGGKWLLRMEDVDKPREMTGAADDILRTLEAFGFAWEGEVVYQSQRVAFYENAFSHLLSSDLIYACTCSRKEIADSAANSGIDGAVYPKTCYVKTLATNTSNFNAATSLTNTASWRVNVDNADLITLDDEIQGHVSQQLSEDVGDFILKRKDGFFAYQLAVVVDDALQNITHVVRGADLLDSTPRQIYLQQLLDFTTPHYAHVPVVVTSQGEKLSKQTLATAITPQAAPILVFQALQFLGQNPPTALKNVSLSEIWAWAIANWHLESIYKQKTMQVHHGFNVLI